jgi:hypothetical protein
MKCAPEQASIPINRVCKFAEKASSCLREHFLLTITLPLTTPALQIEVVKANSAKTAIGLFVHKVRSRHILQRLAAGGAFRELSSTVSGANFP